MFDIQAWLEIRWHKELEFDWNLHSHPHKIMEVHKLKPPDDKARIHFCNWLLLNVNDGIMDRQLLILTNEALP